MNADVRALRDRMTELEQSNRRWRNLAVGALLLLGLITSAALVGPAAAGLGEPERRVAQFDEITVGRVNIAGPDGVHRMILAHEMPPVPFQGHTLQRTVPPGMAGIIFCAPNGDEVGGIGASGTERFGHSLMGLDYRHTPVEAVALGTRYGPNGQSAGLVVMDNPSGTIDIAKLAVQDETEIAQLQAMMIERVLLGVEDHYAGLAIKDRNGQERIVIGVSAANVPEIKILDEDGAELWRLAAD